MSHDFEVAPEVNREATRFLSKVGGEIPAGAVPAKADQVEKGIQRKRVKTQKPVDWHTFVLNVDLEILGPEARDFSEFRDRHFYERAVQ